MSNKIKNAVQGGIPDSIQLLIFIMKPDHYLADIPCKELLQINYSYFFPTI